MSARTLRLAFFGTPRFAVPTLERLLAGRHPVVCVTTQPDRPRGRGRRPSPSPVAEVALRNDTPLLRPERVDRPEFAAQLRAFEPDLGVVVAFGAFLPKRIREAPRLGYLLNAHASLLPRWRGAAPIEHAILAGDAQTGVSVMRVEREMDAGPVALVRATPIGEDETAGALAERLAALAADAIAEAVEAAAGDRIAFEAQDPAGATEAPKIERSDAELDFREPAVALVRRVRAFAPRPGAFAQRGDEPLRILSARALAGAAADPPGTVRLGDDPPLRIATGDGWLAPLRLQRAGGRPLDTESFLRGRPFRDGERLGPRAPATLPT
ncbi:MAG: methionyl-tRNA formyltransferase [Deltaproteobacteria bacterium]|nr:MAG: methionyl-tRNA formyltransferase [Deltaproteobacteria bacterium]